MKQTLLRIGTNAAACMLLLVMLVISFSCIESPLEPVAPMSDIVLEGISILDVTKYFRDVEAKSQGTVINSDSTMSYVSTQYSNPVKIDSMKLQMSPSAQQAAIGQFRVAPFSLSVPPIEATKIDTNFKDGTTLPFLPEQTFTLAPVTINDTADFDFISVATGTITLSITNNLPVPIDFPQGIILRNKIVDAVTIADFSFPSIAANSTVPVSVSAPVDGMLMRGLMGTDSIKIHTSGSGSAVTFSSSSNLSISFQSTPFIADSAAAKIPQQTLASIDSLNTVVLDDSVIVESASFSAGSFQMKLDNNLGIKVGARFIINELLYNGPSININDSLDPKTSKTWSYDGKFLRIQTTPSGVGTKLTYRVGINTISSGIAKQTITKNDYVSASIIPGSPLVIKSVTGKIKTQIIPINSVTASGLDFKDVKNLTVDSIRFKNVLLTLHFPSSPITVGYPMDYDLTVVAKSKGRPVDSLKVRKGDNGFTRIYPSNPVISLSNVPNFDSFISKFIPIAPDSFYIHGSIILNPDFADPATSSYTIDATSQIYPSFDINFPCSIGITNGVIRDTIGFTKSELPKDFTKAVVSGKLSFNFVNAIPLKMSFSADFLGNYSTQKPKGEVLLKIAPTAPFDTIKAAQVDNNGYSSAPTVSKVVIEMNGDQMAKFNQADSLAIRFGIATSNNGQVVKVRAQDYIRVYAKGDITYTVNKP